MRCKAPVWSKQAIGWRVSRDPSRRCQREAKPGRHCCYQHYRWEAHFRIVERIRAIENRDIL